MTNDSKDYKDTLNLPQTAFPMKANLTNKEPEILSKWEEKKVYQTLMEQGVGKETYILHDGPPYANGNIHIGHALNKILKDIIVKYQRLKGKHAPYVPGWDCHGLPIELQVDKKLGSKKAEASITEIRRLCREYALKYIDIQRDEFIRLGILGDWQDPYITMKYEYEAAIIREFYKFYETGGIYKGKKPVHWCSSCVTALAEAEVEYNDKVSPSVFVKFKVSDDSVNNIYSEAKDLGLYIVIWTTTPWTLPANLALAVNPNIEYGILKGDSYNVVAVDLIERLKSDIGIEGELVSRIKGQDLIGTITTHPFIDRQSQVVAGDFVSVEDGTGIVHIAPGHGEDDYIVGLKNGLDIYAPVDEHGKFTLDFGELKGKFVFSANKEIIEILKQKNALIKHIDITHSYPHCWRCKRPVIFRATEQWFISMKINNLKENSLKEIEKVNWVPSWGKDRILSMMKNRPDWCISRQRSWGVPIAMFTCQSCGKIVEDKNVFDRIIGLFKEKSADIWFELTSAELLPQGYICSCGKGDFKKETDILDVWFDSGVSHGAVLDDDTRLSFPADMYLEGSDQHRGWFQSSLLTSTATKGCAPFKTVLTHGFTVDGKGKKMSKSIGNTIAPQDIIKKNGADILRLWTAAEDYRNDIRISEEIIQRLTEAYRKIRNTCRFLLGNIGDFDGGDYKADLLEIDRFAMSRLSGLIKHVDIAYENYDFHEVFHRIYNFCIVDLSSFYLDILKDRIYTFGKNSKDRKAAQWTMNEILNALTVLMSPILSFTAEEVYGYINKDESVFQTSFPHVDTSFIDEELDTRWLELKKIRDVVNKALELKRAEKVIGNSLEAKVTIFAEEPHFSLLKKYEGFLPTLFIVSEVLFSIESQEYESDDLLGLKVGITRAEGGKCLRCWNVSTTVGTFMDYPDLCNRCHDVMTS
ncbi:MAG: isoleucine--tRNA ligase [Nitrospirae bacterium]|nr:isoleucine--tRNA ligase [Nitrospirota bacterium]